jgi:hypothetical protein
MLSGMRAALVLGVLVAVSGQQPTAVQFSTLSKFDWQRGMKLPDKVRQLDGKKIAIVGFVRSEDGRAEDITDFWLIDQACDCEGTPKMNEMIWCTMPDGQKFANDGSPVEVVGSFEASEDVEGDYVLSLYRLKVTSVR